MGPSTIMIIRHAEKPGIYNKTLYNGINAVGQQDPASLVTMGWERAGGIASLFSLQAGLPTPDYIYASNPLPQPATYKTEPNGNMVESLTSQRPYQTISALSAKLNMSSETPPGNLITSFGASDYHDMVKDAITKTGTVLIAWQHQYILPHHEHLLPPPAPAVKTDSIVYELFCQTGTVNAQTQEQIPSSFGVPTKKWPSDRYDMVFVLQLSSAGLITSFTQVPQMLLAGDSSQLFV